VWCQGLPCLSDVRRRSTDLQGLHDRQLAVGSLGPQVACLLALMPSASRRRPSHAAPRKSAHDRGYNHSWRKASKLFLKLHPLCVIHLKEGRLIPATCVDHKIPHKGDDDLFWNRSNWQPLCKRCHDQKTAREDG